MEQKKVRIVYDNPEEGRNSVIEFLVKKHKGNPEYDMKHKDFGFMACEKCKKRKATRSYSFGFHTCVYCARTIANKPQTINTKGWKIR